MHWYLTILGSSSATPTDVRYPSAQVLNCNNVYFLIDCGEGAQIQMRKYKVKFQRIDHIFISHLHGDHYLGLMGLLFTFHLFGRTSELHIYAHKKLEEIIMLQLEASATTLTYPLVFHHLPEDEQQQLYKDDNIEIFCFPLQHRIPTHGFIFRELQTKRNIIKEKITEYNLSFDDIVKIKSGENYITKDGIIIENAQLTHPLPEPKSYAYCSDTAYSEKYLKFIENVTMLYHEATYTHDMEDLAQLKQHSTTVQAAMVAAKANVKKLLIGHFSVRYDDIEPLIGECKKIFSNCEAAFEGKVYEI